MNTLSNKMSKIAIKRNKIPLSCMDLNYVKVCLPVIGELLLFPSLQ